MVVTLTPAEVARGAHVGVTRRVSSMARGCAERNGAGRSTVAARWYSNIVGACGELAVAKLLGLKWRGLVDQAKSEPDIEPDIQVRTLACAGYDLIVRADDGDNFRYVLVTGEPPEFNVVGWIFGSDAKRAEWYRDRGERNAPCYWVPQRNLQPMGCLEIKGKETANR